MGVRFAPLGIGIQYYRCTTCGLIFTNVFDQWDYSEFKKYIYNEDYLKIDPDYAHDRPLNNAGVVYDFIKKKSDVCLLDYGGGNGKFAALLRQKGISAESWDPMEENQGHFSEASFDIVTSFEVFEHTPDPHASTAEALRFLKPEGVFLFSTLTEESGPPRTTDHWYIAPRNGHITIYTKESLRQLFSQHGYQLLHFSELTHLAYKTLPAWLG